MHYVQPPPYKLHNTNIFYFLKSGTVYSDVDIMIYIKSSLATVKGQIFNIITYQRIYIRIILSYVFSIKDNKSTFLMWKMTHVRLTTGNYIFPLNVVISLTLHGYNLSTSCYLPLHLSVTQCPYLLASHNPT